MPVAALTPCEHAGCPALVASGRCPEHKRDQRRKYDTARGTSTERGYDVRWRRFVAAYRAGLDLNVRNHGWAHQLAMRNRCRACWERDGVLTKTGLEYDHIIPLSRGGARLDPANVQPLCRACHERKTRAEAQ